MKHHRVLSLLLITSSFCLSATSLAQRADSLSTIEEQVLDFRGQTLTKVLQELVNDKALNLVYEPALLANKTTQCKMPVDSLESILRCVLEETGLTYCRLRPGVFVIRKSITPSSVPDSLGKKYRYNMSVPSGNPGQLDSSDRYD